MSQQAVWAEVDRLMARILGFIHIALGVAVLLGGPERFPPPNYGPLLSFSDGEVWPYGIIWIFGGLLMMFCRNVWGRLVGMFIIVVLANLWAALFGLAAYQDPTASFTPTVAYGGYALMNATLFWLTYIHSRPEHEDE